VIEIKIAVGIKFFNELIMESAGTEGEALYTLYPLDSKTDSIILQAKLCCSPFGVHIKIVPL
jgi:hypothetical protein